MSTNQEQPPIALAILDDYPDIASQHFTHLTDSHHLKPTKFPNTLNPKDATQKQDLITRLHPFTIISTMRERTPFSADVLSNLPNLKLLLTTGMRNASLDIQKATELGIVVAGTPNGGSRQVDSTTQHTWALILGIAKNIARDDRVVKTQSDKWQSGLNTGLAGKTFCALGLGKLGGLAARIAVVAFDMKVLAWSASLTQEKADERARELGLELGTFLVTSSKEELFEKADVLSVHYVLSARSKGIVGAEDLALMKPSALFVNTSRGPLVDEEALLDCLRAGSIRGAAIDVFDVEPLPKDSAWRTTRWGEDGTSQVLLTPHMGYVEEEKMHTWYSEQADNVQRWLDGGEVQHRFN